MQKHLSRGLIFPGWGLFALSLTYPAVRDAGKQVEGWWCLVQSLLFCLPPLWFLWEFAILGVTNALVLTSVVVYCEGAIERKTYGVFLSVFAFASVSIVLQRFGGVMSPDLLTGFYLWASSLGATALGFLLSEMPERLPHP
jgi:hypothetical protein